MRSIRTNILSWIILLVIVTNGLGLLGSYLVARHYQQELMDASLAQRARVLLHLLEEYPTSQGPDVVDWAASAFTSLGMDLKPGWQLANATRAGSQTMWVQVWFDGQCYAPLMNVHCDPNNSLKLDQNAFGEQSFAGETWRTFAVYSVRHNAWVQTAFPKSLQTHILAQGMWRAWGRQMLVITPITLLLAALVVGLSLRPLRRMNRALESGEPSPQLDAAHAPKELVPVLTALEAERQDNLRLQKRRNTIGGQMVSLCEEHLQGVHQAMDEGALGERRARYHLGKLDRQLLQARLWLLLSDEHEPDGRPQELYRQASLSVARHYGLARSLGQRLVLRGVDRELWVGVPEAPLRAMLDSLIDNALRYSPPNSEVLVSVRRSKGGRALVTLSDAGPGLPVEAIDSAQRLDDASNWLKSGFGLALVRAVSERYQVRTEIGRSELYGGTKVVLSFDILSDGDPRPRLG
ncbi:ATP-binding protein [Ferrimonas balearica]|uniref:ATP-binding protein n=1 Tax=Ferrimonas balearica TaxID=44012 RepID=UPI001C997460|nr:ATP-binding protein [Ferrimonas balearica]MBY5993509.1 sensor histidine kinase N-terminal domain-containing protein [Ferrimonas balearica]